MQKSKGVVFVFALIVFLVGELSMVSNMHHEKVTKETANEKVKN